MLCEQYYLHGKLVPSVRTSIDNIKSRYRQHQCLVSGKICNMLETNEISVNPVENLIAHFVVQLKVFNIPGKEESSSPWLQLCTLQVTPQG
jgi:hypothetical protein